MGQSGIQVDHVSVITYGTEWNLRMSSVRSTAAVFIVFGHPTYQKLISNHISDLLILPRSVLLMAKGIAILCHVMHGRV